MLCACGAGGSKSGHEARLVVAKKTTRGKHASATASMDAGQYRTFFARVTAAPDQRIAGSWVIGCRGFNSMSHDAGDVKGKTPLTVRMRTTQAEAYGMAPGSGHGTCTVVTVATLTRSGTIDGRGARLEVRSADMTDVHD